MTLDPRRRAVLEAWHDGPIPSGRLGAARLDADLVPELRARARARTFRHLANLLIDDRRGGPRVRPDRRTLGYYVERFRYWNRRAWTLRRRRQAG